MSSHELRPQVLAALPLALLLLPCTSAQAAEPEAEGIDAPMVEPVDDHLRPDFYEAPGFADSYQPIPSQAPAEYPLAVSFNPADPSNHSNGGMISYDYVVVHTIQGSYSGAQSWFQNPAANVSAHYIARSSDGEITQMVYMSDKAWHVGSSNPYSIGIEHEGWVDEPAWYTWEMYTGSAKLARWIADEFGMPLDREHIVGHVELPNQTHTDPGIHWDWDLYMALIHDLVGEGRLEGYVADASALCTVTANSDTWIKTTLEPSAELGDTQKCFVPAGTQITYSHASPDMMGHQRLHYSALTGPCDGFIDLDTEGFIFSGHFSATCDNASKAAAGVTVKLDGGAEVVTDANGYFAFSDVGPGPHSVDVVGDANYYGAMAPVDMDVYPGARAIITVDPVDDGGTGDGDTGDGDTTTTTGDGDSADTGECWIGSEGCSCTDGGGCDPGLVCDPTFTCVPDGSGEGGDGNTSGNGDEAGTGGDDPGLDYLEGEDGCSCSTEDDERGGLLGLLGLGLLGLGLYRRRR